MTRPVLFTGDIFRQQARGGVTRYFVETIRRLRRPARVVAGLHRSAAGGELGGTFSPALRVPPLPGAMRAAAPFNRLLDGFVFSRAANSIVHPTYYRDPTSLPARAPVVVTVYDLTHERFPELLPAAGPERWKASLCARADRVLCLSEATRRDVVEMLNVPSARTRVTPLASREWDGVAQVEVPGLQRPFALWVGERRGYKNFDRTLAAWESLPQTRGIGILCAGGLPQAPRPHGARVPMWFQRTLTDGELRWAYENAVGLLYTSLWEGFGMPVLEAFSLGCPVVCSDRGSLPEVGGEAAFYADPENVDSLRDAIARMLERGRDMSRVQLARQQNRRFTWRHCADLHEAAYRELD